MAGRARLISFDPDVWMSDSQVRNLSDQAKAIWMDLICVLFKQSHGAGSLERQLGWWAGAVFRSTERVLSALKELQKLGTADIEPVLPDSAAEQQLIRVTCRRMVRDAGKRGARSRNQAHWRAGRIANDVDDHVDDSCFVNRSTPTPCSPPRAPPLTPASPSSPSLAFAREGSQAAPRARAPEAEPKIPEGLQPFPRWHRSDAVHERQRSDQRRFVAAWEERLAEWRAAFPGLDVLAAVREFYAYEGSLPAQKRATPAGRARAIHSSLNRAQDRAGIAAARRGPTASRNGATPHGGDGLAARAAAAWSALRSRMADVSGGRDSGEIADEVARETWFKFGGWRGFGGRDERTNDFKRADFIATYVQRAQQPSGGSIPPAAAERQRDGR